MGDKKERFGAGEDESEHFVGFTLSEGQFEAKLKRP